MYLTIPYRHSLTEPEVRLANSSQPLVSAPHSTGVTGIPITVPGFYVCSRHLESDHHAYIVNYFDPVGHLSSLTGLIYTQSLLIPQTHSLFSQSTEVEGSLCCLNVYSLLEYVSYKYAANMDSFITHAVGSHLLTVNVVLYTPKEIRCLL